MKEINLKITGDSGKSPVIQVDGETVKFKKNKFGSSDAIVKTEKDIVELSVFRYLEINSPWWIVTSILFFIISVFGIFDCRNDKLCKVVEFKTKITLKDQNNVKISLNNLKDGRVDIKTDCECEELINKCYQDKNAKKKLKILLAIKIVLWIVAVVVAVYLIVTKLTGK